MHKETKLQSLLKKSKLNTTFEISLFLHQFISLSLIKQGKYFIKASLCSKVALLKQQYLPGNLQNNEKTMCTNIFFIKYNNHTQMLNHLFTFTFYFEEGVINRSHDTNNNKLLLIFQLHRCKSEQSEMTEQKYTEECQNVAQYIFQMKIKEDLSFIQYFEVKFQMPYTSELQGCAICLMTNFQITQSQNVMSAQKQLMSSNEKPDKYLIYLSLLSHLKKLVKQHRFSLYSVQKLIQATFIGFHSKITIPSLKFKKFGSQHLSLATNSVSQKTLVKFQFLNDLKSYVGVEMVQIPIPQISMKWMQQTQKQCNDEQFMNYLTFIEYEDRKVQSLLNQLKRIGNKNISIFQQIQRYVDIIGQQYAPATYRIQLQSINQQYQRKRQIIYNQKIKIFGLSLVSAAQQMKLYTKHISSLKQKKKQNFFTTMNQLFNIIPQPEFQLDTSRFDKCPSIHYSNSQYKNGICQQQIEKSDDDWDQESNTSKIGKKQKSFKKQECRNVFLLAHGYQASSTNMQKLKLSFRKLFSHSKFLLLKSFSQHMDHSIEQMGKKAGKQIQQFLNELLNKTSSKKIRIIMVGHSMGGIILRSSLQFIPQKFHKFFHTFISFGTPHLGYLNCKNLLTETGMKLIESMHPSLSLKQLSNKDNSNIKQTYIYKLADRGSLKQFQNIVTLSSIADKYVPWNSARIQLYKQPEGIGGKNTTGGWSLGSQKHYIRYVQQQMFNQILGIGQKNSKIKNIYRFDVDFNISHVNLDSMIGRTAHVAFLANEHILSMIFKNCLSTTLYSELQK